MECDVLCFGQSFDDVSEQRSNDGKVNRTGYFENFDQAANQRRMNLRGFDSIDGRRAKQSIYLLLNASQILCSVAPEFDFNGWQRIEVIARRFSIVIDRDLNLVFPIDDQIFQRQNLSAIQRSIPEHVHVHIVRHVSRRTSYWLRIRR